MGPPAHLEITFYTSRWYNSIVTKSTEVPPQTGAEDLRPSSRTRYGLYLAPSEELSELIDLFLNQAALTALKGKEFRLTVSQKPVDVLRGDGKEDGEIDALIGEYSRLIEKYQERPFRLKNNGFSYVQERRENVAVTRLSFGFRATLAAYGDIMRPPFFESNTKAPPQASILFKSSDVVPNADSRAIEVMEALASKHQSAVDGMAQFAFYLTGLRVVSREILTPATLSLVKPNQ